MKHKIEQGETFYKIARDYQTSIKSLKDANPSIRNPNLIQVGQTINIPDPAFTPITEEQLRAIVPSLTTLPPLLIESINDAMREANINTAPRQAAFLAQIAHETGGFRWFRELGNQEYFKKYDTRKDLGNVHRGDGARYRGRGFIQITGRTNYELASKAIGVDLIDEPHLAENPDIGAQIAGWFWASHDLNRYADGKDFITITRIINGGLNGLKSREEYYERAKTCLA